MHDLPSLWPQLPSKPIDPDDVRLMLEPSRGSEWETCWEFVLSHQLTPSEGSAFWHGANLVYEAMRQQAER
jgi:hypothetical protein